MYVARKARQDKRIILLIAAHCACLYDSISGLRPTRSKAVFKLGRGESVSTRTV